MDADEQPEDALHREIREELGARIGLGDELVGPDDGLWRLSDEYVMRIWLAEVVEGTPEPLEEHDELRWLPMSQWHDVPWLDADIRIVDALQDHLSRAGGTEGACRRAAASVRIADDVAKLSRTCPAPSTPNVGPGLTARPPCEQARGPGSPENALQVEPREVGGLGRRPARRPVGQQPREQPPVVRPGPPAPRRGRRRRRA